MHSKNAIAIVHVMADMRGMHKLYVCYLEHRRWICVEVSKRYFWYEHRGREIAPLKRVRI